MSSRDPNVRIWWEDHSTGLGSWVWTYDYDGISLTGAGCRSVRHARRQMVRQVRADRRLRRRLKRQGCLGRLLWRS